MGQIVVNPEAVTAAVDLFAAFLLRYAIALAGVGALAMGLIEAWKKIFDTRTKYHMREVLDWFGSARDAYGELIHLTTGAPLQAMARPAVEEHQLLARSRTAVPPRFEISLYSLELERMMGHVQDAATTALRDPRRFPNLYAFLTDGASPEDIRSWETVAYAAPAPNGFSSNERANLYARLHAAAKGQLDGFQLYTGHRWANMNQVFSIVVGAVVLGGALVWAQIAANKAWTPGTIALFCILSLLGGALSPIAKDLVVALKRVRSGG